MGKQPGFTQFGSCLSPEGGRLQSGGLLEDHPKSGRCQDGQDMWQEA